jgi:hypothetical protein
LHLKSAARRTRGSRDARRRDDERAVVARPLDPFEVEAALRQRGADGAANYLPVVSRSPGASRLSAVALFGMEM